MGWLSLYSKSVTFPPNSQETLTKNSNFPSLCSFPWSISSTQKIPFNFPSSFSSNTSKFTVNCNGNETLSTSSAYYVLGVSPNCSLIDLKAAFRAKVCTLSINSNYSFYLFIYLFLESMLHFISGSFWSYGLFLGTVWVWRNLIFVRR